MISDDEYGAEAEIPPGEISVHAGPTLGSEAGADHVRPMVGKLGDQILEWLRRAGDHGLTNGELSRLLDGRDVTVWPRVSSLKQRGKVRDSGRTRPSPITGVKMTVWILTSPEEEREILDRRRLEEAALVEPPGQEAHETAQRIATEWDSGGPMFRTHENLASMVQDAINRRLQRMSATARRQMEREALHD